jgi:ElaB/YqjD/DUF883 family membrane-anchored ribosome-binding protein
VRRRTNESLEAGNRYVHDRPWSAIGVAAVSAFIVGLLIRTAATRSD